MPYFLNTRRRARQAGLSLVEMMVGITIGLIVVAAASLMMTNQVTENSRLLQETQLQQDLRTAADLMMRDLRRAGYSLSDTAGVWQPTSPAVAGNVYAPTSPRVVDDDELLYAYARVAGNATTLPRPNESFGFRRNTINVNGVNIGVIYAINGTLFDPAAVPQSFQFPSDSTPSWQPLTDPNTINITDFKVNLVVQPTALGAYANPPSNCAVGDLSPPCPCLLVRRFDISITGRAVRDAKVERTLQISSRLRNDQVVPSCTAPT